MDKFGVPKKINRHVIKAISVITDQNSENSDLLNICDAVELSMKNNLPVPDLLSAVRKSLLHLCQLGILRKQGTNYYRNSGDSPSSSRNGSKRVIKRRKLKKPVQDEEIEIKKKRRRVNEDPITEYHPECSVILPRRNKLIARKVKKTHLPKVRKHKLGNSRGETEQDSCSSSSNEQIYSEEVNSNKQNFLLTKLEHFHSADNLTRPMLDKIEFDNYSENLLHSLEDNNYSHQLQDNQLEKFDYNSMNNQSTKLETINENQSPPPPLLVAENTNISDNSQPNEQNDLAFLTNNKNLENTDGVTSSAQNIENESTAEISECHYLI